MRNILRKACLILSSVVLVLFIIGITAMDTPISLAFSSGILRVLLIVLLIVIAVLFIASFIVKDSEK